MNTKTVFVNFIRKYRKSILFILMLFFVVSLVSLFNLEANTNQVQIQKISKNTVETSPYYGYDKTIDSETNNIIYTPNNVDPQIYIELSKEKINQITIFFANKVRNYSSIQVYYSHEGEGLSESRSTGASILKNEKAAIITLPEGNFNLVRLDIDATFSIDYIETQYIEFSEVYRTLSIPALISLIFIICVFVLFFIFEKQLGFFDFIKSTVINQVDFVTTAFSEKKYATVVFRLINIFNTIILVVSYIILMMLTRINSKCVVYIATVSIIFTVFFVIDHVIFSKRIVNPSFTFLVLALVIGLTFAISFPPLSGVAWDDQIHYDRCVSLKCLIFNNERTLADNGISSIKYEFRDYYVNHTEYIKSLLYDDSIPIFSNASFVNLYEYIGYLPVALTMALCEAVNSDFITTIVLSRMSNILLYAFVIYFGIKKLKSGALLFSSICLLPTSLFLAASFSYDYWVIAFVAYVTAYFIAELQNPEKKISVKDYIIMFGAMIIGCGPKAIYFFLTIPLLFMDKNKFENDRAKRNYRIITVITMLIILASFIVPFVLDTGSKSDIRGGTDVNSAEQLKFILTNPIKYANILIKFLCEYISFSMASPHIVDFAYLGIPRNIFGTLAIVIMMFCAFLDKSGHDDFENVLQFKVASAITVIGQLMLVATALYISFTPVASEWIGGCQYRYIIPTLFIALYIFGSAKTKNHMNKKFLNTIVFTALAFNLFMTYYEVFLKIY